MKIRTIEFQKTITPDNLKISIKYHLRKLRELYAKANKNCFITIYTKIYNKNIDVIGNVDKYVLNVSSNREIRAYCLLITVKCLNIQKKDAGSKISRIDMFYQETNEKTYIDFTSNPTAIINKSNLI